MDFSPLWISLETSVTATAVALVLGIAAARWRVNAPAIIARWVDTLLLLPLALPPTVIGFALLVTLGKHGWLGVPLAKLGISIVFSWPATVIAATVVAFPLVYLTVYGAFLQIDREHYDAARVMGASEMNMFLHITLPQAWPGILSGMLLGFTRALGEFGATLMLAGNIPGKTQTMPLAIYFSMESGDTSTALLFASLSAVVCLAVVTAQNRWWRETW